MAEKEQASLYRRWNPTSLDDICGNAIAVAKCRTLISETAPSKRPGFYIFTGDTGCVSGETRIETPFGTRRIDELYREGTPFLCLAYDSKINKCVPAIAAPPVKKGRTKLIKLVTREGLSVRIAPTHYLLGASGHWLSALEVRPGCELFRPPSTSDIAPSIRDGDEHRSTKTASDFQSDCLQDLRLRDERFPSAKVFDQGASPSEDDAPGHILSDHERPILRSGHRHIPCGSVSYLPSKPDCFDRKAVALEGSGSFPGCSLQQNSELAFQATKAFLQSFVAVRQTDSDISLLRELPKEVPSEPLEFCGSEAQSVCDGGEHRDGLRSDPLSCPVIEEVLRRQCAFRHADVPETVSDLCGQELSFGTSSWETLIVDTVTTEVTDEEYYDFAVPNYNNYVAEGILHHNCGKSTLVHILFEAFGCGDIRVFNSRECGKVDFVTDFLTQELPAASLMSSRRAFIFEEAHNITAAAQEMFMEPLEKGIPANTYVAFVTNSPEKLTGGKGALLSRPYRIETVRVKPEQMEARLRAIAAGEPLQLADAEIAICARSGNGSVRVAINNMARLAALPPDLRPQEIERIRVESDTASGDFAPSLKDLALALESQSWDRVAEVLRRLRENGEDPEGLRRGLLAWHSGVMLSDKPFCRPKREFSRTVIDALRDNYYNTGFAGLVGDLSHIATEGI